MALLPQEGWVLGVGPVYANPIGASNEFV